MKGYTKLYRY